MGITLGFILLVWVLDILFHLFLTDGKPGSSSFLFPGNDSHELFMHILIVFLFLAFGIVLTLKTIRIHRSEQELLEKTEQYRLIATYSNDVIWKMSPTGKFLYVSPSVEKLRGFTPEEVIRQLPEEVLTPSSLEVYRRLMNRLTDVMKENPGSCPSVITELEQPRKDGSAVWTEASVTTALKEDGHPDFFIGVSRDITERKRREEELRKSEEYYRLLAQTSLDYIIVHDMEGIILYANPAGLKASGYEMDDLSGHHILELIPKNYHYLVDEMRQKRIGGDFKTYKYEMEFKSKDGKTHPVEISSAPIVINKTPISSIISAMDISERKEAERKSREVQNTIKKINAELESKVEERTYMLQEAYKELESFSYSVSHDLRAPLRHIDTFSRLLKDCIENKDNNKCRQYLSSILESTSKMKELIDSLLQLSRTGRTELRRESFEMKIAVNQVVKDMDLENPENGIKWVIHELGNVNADPSLVKQLWHNLIANSVKFTRNESNPKIEVGKRLINDRESWYIKDNGVGFDSRYMEKLFGVFQRLHTEEEFEGTGIGLATVKRIIDRHRGEIWAESRPGDGATFYFYLS